MAAMITVEVQGIPIAVAPVIREVEVLRVVLGVREAARSNNCDGILASAT
jgi:hypothetical protein